MRQAACDFAREAGLSLYGNPKKFLLCCGPKPASIALPPVEL